MDSTWANQSKKSLGKRIVPIVVETRSLDMEERTYYLWTNPLLRVNSAYVMKGIHFCEGTLHM